MAELARITVEPREPLAAEVSRRLIDYLMSGEVQPGDRIPSERQLTEMLGVNRPTVREAIKSLASSACLRSGSRAARTSAAPTRTCSTGSSNWDWYSASGVPGTWCRPARSWR